MFPGCPAEEAKVPFDTKDINMSEYLLSARAEDFIGRQWLYREVEDAFKDDSIGGVLIIGNPGTGKSAWSSQLICSRTTSYAIHAHILGYHLCKYSDKNTQMAGKFVRNLAEMIARRLPEYGYIVSNSSYIQRSFDLDCIQNHDPVGCFEQTVITPLRNLKNEPIHNWFIMVDALDECLSQGERSDSIIYLLENKITRFPHWLKLIMTSRNESEALLRSTKITKLVIDPEDFRNLEDIEIFVMTRLYQPSALLGRITSWFGDDGIESTTKLAAALLSKSQGNFLFVKELLNHWEHSRHELGNAYALPKSLEDLYHGYFERLYPGKRSFRPARHILELLVSTFEPLHQKEIFEVLRIKDNDLDEEYNFKNRLKELGHFLKYGKNNTITLYHLSLTNWLTSEGNEKYFVSRKKGHKMLSEYYFNLVKDGDESKLSKYIFPLAQHVAFGGLKETYTQEFFNFPSQTVNSSNLLSEGRTLLHLAATINSTDVLDLLLPHFSCIDCVDSRGITPAFLAAKRGLRDNLKFLVKKGADVNHKTKSINAFYKAKERTAFDQGRHDFFQFHAPFIVNPVFEIKSKFFDASMLHAAAQGSHVSVVRFLLENNASISTVNGAHLTAIQIAAENGHLEVVKTLHKAGAIPDQTALHHAAANNRLQVVNFLLEVGVKDECLKCDGSFSWLEQTEEGDQFYDDKHLILCRTALHAAAASGYDKIVARLLAEEHNALNCHDYSGRSPLHEAVRKNHPKIVDILLDKEPRMIHYKCEHWQEVDATELRFDELSEYYADVCHCGYTPLHLAARYGHQQMAILLMRKGARLDERDCTGATPIHVVACHNHAGLIFTFSHPNIGGDINTKTSNGSTPLHSAASCGAVDVIDYLRYKRANLTAVDDNGLTALHYSIRNIKSSELNRIMFLNDSVFNGTLTPVIIDRRGHLSGFFSEKKQIKSTDRLHWLDTLLKLLFTGSRVDAADVKGQTTLHVAAQNGLADAVNVLLQMNASLEIKDINGKTPLEVAVENAPIIPIHTSFLIGNKIEDLRGFLRDHEMAGFLLLSYGASIGKCKQKEGSLLHRAILNQQPYIVQLLLLKGASLRCRDSLGRTPLITYLQNGGNFIDVVLRDFTVSVAIQCRRPFNSSLFHLLSWRLPTDPGNNFFHSTKCTETSQNPECEVKKGPLAVAIESHPEKERIISSCFDAEGFTPLHRAAQGANLVATRYLLAIGANDSTSSPHGQDALTLAVLHAGRRRLWERHELVWVDGDYLHLIQAEQVAIELLHHAIKNRGYKIRCDSTKSDLTLYHLAASRGLVKFIEAIFNESDLHQLDADCANADGITPMYLAKLFEERVQDGLENPWEQVIQIIKRHGGKMRYPRKNVEHNIIYNGVYGWIPNEFTINLRPDIVHFITSLLTSYEKKEKKSFRCFFHRQIDLTRENAYYWPVIWLWEHINFSVKSLMRESEEVQPNSNTGRRQCSREEEYFRRDWGRCSLHLKQFRQYMSKILFPRQAYPKNIAKLKNWEVFSKVQRNWIQKEFLRLMKMRHTEVFRTFACFKSLSSRFKPVYHLDARSVTFSIRRFEKNPPVDNYLNSICDSIKYIFENYISFRKSSQQPSEFRLRDNELFSRSGFFNGPVKIFRHASFIGSNPIEWPLEFFLRRSVGFFRRYDYLKTLHIGKEPRTYVHLYPDKIRQLMDRNKMWYGHSQLAMWFKEF